MNKIVDYWLIHDSKVENPRYTIVIPTFNRTDTFIKSLQTAINQEYSNYDILIVDNNPERNDETEKAMQMFCNDKVMYIKNKKNIGMVNNWNQGAVVAKGEWCVFVHDDDLLTKECLNIIDKTRKDKKNIYAVLPNFKQAWDNTVSKEVSERKIRYRIIKSMIPKGFPKVANLFCDNIFGPPTCGLAIKKESLCLMEGWNADYITADWEFMLRFSERFKIARASKQTGVYIWAVNTTLKPGVQERFAKEGRQYMNLLIKQSMLCRFIVKILKKDFKKKWSGNLTDIHDYSLFFKFFQKYYSIKIS